MKSAINFGEVIAPTSDLSHRQSMSKSVREKIISGKCQNVAFYA
jgi:hypothetical protein